MRIRDWSSDVCSSDLFSVGGQDDVLFDGDSTAVEGDGRIAFAAPLFDEGVFALTFADGRFHGGSVRSEEHTSELQSLMRISYAVFCLKKKKNSKTKNKSTTEARIQYKTSVTPHLIRMQIYM